MTTELQSLVKTLRIGRKDPIKLLRGLYPSLVLDEWQEATIRAVWANPRTAVVSCNGAGKTLVIALILILFMICFSPAVVISTAGSWAQVRRQLWKEIHRWWSLLPEAYQFGTLNTTDWEISPSWYALGLSTNNPGLFEGFHGPFVLVVVDEAKSVEQGIFDAINRIFAGPDDVRCIQSSSAGLSAGPHFDAFHGKAERWCRIKVNPFEAWIESPSGERRQLEPTPRLTAEFIEEMRNEYGESSPLFQSMIMAAWTEQSEFKLFDLHTLGLIESPVHETRVMIDRWMGVDVARGGDDECAIAVVEDYIVEEPEYEGKIFTGLLEMHAFHTDDVMVLDDALRQRGYEYNVPRENINIDEGSFGGAMIDGLRRRKWNVTGIQFGAGSLLTSPNCKNLVSEMWWKASRKARKGLLTGVTQPRLKSQLNHRKYGYTDTDEMMVESKKVMSKRIRKEFPNLSWNSPDWADSYLLACYRGKRAHEINTKLLLKLNPKKQTGLITSSPQSGKRFRVRG